MKVFAQHGHQPSDKITGGLTEGVIQGAILSARYLPPDRAIEKINELTAIQPGAEIVLDSEFYASRLFGTPNAQIGSLEKWSFLGNFRRRDLVRSQTVERALRTVFDSVAHLPVTAHIAPNIYISQSFDSMEAGIALNFIERSNDTFAETGLPVYATIAVDCKALLSPNDFLSFLNDITAMESRPTGFYLIVGGGPITERSDIAQSELMDANVLGGWMMLNYALRENGFRVINGYSDVLSPFLTVAGAAACATGWWSNLRTFSMGRYVRSNAAGGQLPIIRYLSKLLLNRIKRDQLTFSEIIPGILNGLPHDMDYDGETSRTTEALQTWEAISSLNNDVQSSSISDALSTLDNMVTQSEAAYSTLNSYGISAGHETSLEYLEQLRGGVEVFRKLAEI
ncbi:MAG: hypothetical protein IPN69_06410 [Acidobacteria bacterium]|nr:hypothetical protein [Acidobacteriota bacterium]